MLKHATGDLDGADVQNVERAACSVFPRVQAYHGRGGWRWLFKTLSDFWHMTLQDDPGLPKDSLWRATRRPEPYAHPMKKTIDEVGGYCVCVWLPQQHQWPGFAPACLHTACRVPPEVTVALASPLPGPELCIAHSMRGPSHALLHCSDLTRSRP
jgi:hypothetical protein